MGLKCRVVLALYVVQGREMLWAKPARVLMMAEYGVWRELETRRRDYLRRNVGVSTDISSVRELGKKKERAKEPHFKR